MLRYNALSHLPPRAVATAPPESGLVRPHSTSPSFKAGCFDIPLTSAIQGGRELTAAEVSAAAAELLRDDADRARPPRLISCAPWPGAARSAAELTGFVREFLQHAVVPPLELGHA
jgi:hypothetical protein